MESGPPGNHYTHAPPRCERELVMATITQASNEDIRELAAVFRVLSDPTRLRILSLLAKGERNVGDLCGDIGLPQPTVSHHLGILRLHSVIQSRRDGKHIYYALDGRAD